MAYHIGVKPGKTVSVLGMVIGGLFVVLGIAVIIPTFGAFGLLWTAMAGAIAVFYAYNFFTRQGIATHEVDVNAPDRVDELDTHLRKLAKLKDDGLLTDQEYERKRAELLRERY
jgi:Short C-terminal domain